MNRENMQIDSRLGFKSNGLLDGRQQYYQPTAPLYSPAAKLPRSIINLCLEENIYLIRSFFNDPPWYVQALTEI